MIEYFKARWAQYRAEEKALNKKLAKISTGGKAGTSMLRDIWFYTFSGVAIFATVAGAMFICGVIIALLNAGLWWITGLIVGA
jgi:hypothetical protein